MGPLTEEYIRRIKELPHTPALARYIALLGTDDARARQEAWEALSADEQAKVQAIADRLLAK
jgi:hypothetical protein